MSNSPSSQHLKSDQKGKAITSLVLGIISAIAVLMFVMINLFPGVVFVFAHMGVRLKLDVIFFAVCPLIAIFVIFGLIVGKAIKRNLAILGLTLGIVSIVLSLIFLLQLGRFPLDIKETLLLAIYLILHLISVGPLIAIFGLILGILSLKSTKRNFAIAGIVLSSIGLIVPIIYFIFY